ncbi:MAG: ABC transporter ATP-binding protein [Caldilineaceae bacterium]|nr:ABC transporter ATP-binding protein [Caldilineaceae bacterium]
MMTNALIDIQDLKIQFFTNEGIVRAVDGVNLTIPRGKTLCVVGESGCGKSVTARALLNIVHKPGRIVGGQVLFHQPNGQGGTTTVDIAQLDPRGRDIRGIRGRHISMIFQEPMSSLSPLYTVGNQIIENVQLHTNATQKEARERAVEMLDLVGIPQPRRWVDEYPFRLSGGMRQRAMIAMALACNPSLLIADEPTTALDVTTQAQILELMQRVQAEYDMAILFITHDLGVVAEIADDVAVMYLGSVVEVGDADTIFNHPGHPYTQSLLRSVPKVTATRQRLEVIQGMVPSPYRRPSGCQFHPRCPQAMAGLCAQQTPAMIEVAPRHQVRCLLYTEEGKAVQQERMATPSSRRQEVAHG